MSHFTVVVCIEDPERLEAALAPFDENREVEPYRDYEEGSPSAHWSVSSLREHEGLNPDDATLTWAELAEAYNRRYDDDTPIQIDEGGRAYSMSTRNKDSKWDWWQIGGRWGGYFPYRQEFAAQVIKPERGWSSPEVIMPLHCDGGLKRALDLDALREEKAQAARKELAEWQSVTAKTPTALPWSSFRENVSEVNGYTVERAREEYHSQRRVQAYQRTDFRWYDDPIAEFDVPAALFVERRKAQAVPGYATLTLDGRWMAQGKMGWFGMSSDTEGSRIGYWETANAYIEALPDDTCLIAVDCHI